MEGAGWEVGPSGYMKLEKADESWRPGEISSSFPNCSGGIKACCGCEGGKGLYSNSVVQAWACQCPSCDETVWLEKEQDLEVAAPSLPPTNSPSCTNTQPLLVE